MDPVTKRYNILDLKQTVYKTFFYPSVCHTCKQSGDDGALKQCGGCRMIAYCNREHQEEHWPEHKDLCKAIQYVRETFTAESFAYQRTPNMMKFLMEKVIEKLERNLVSDELQMFKYPRRCLVCYKINGDVKRCPHCVTVWFCPQHKNNHDSSTCDQLKLCFESEVSLVEDLFGPNVNGSYMRLIAYDKEFSNMKEFINKYGDITRIQSQISPHCLAIKHSIRLSKPLTVLYGLRILEYVPTYEENKTMLVIHIIAAQIPESYFFDTWEILLHIFPKLKYLKLVLLGPLISFTETQEICDICMRKNKSFLVECQTVFYGQYVHKSTFIEPDLVIRFYNEPYDRSISSNQLLEDMWKSSLKYIAERNCPLFLCCSREKLHNELDEIINIELNRTIEFRTYKNPFASLKPYREYNEDSGYSVYYDNYYLTIYKSFCP